MAHFFPITAVFKIKSKINTAALEMRMQAELRRCEMQTWIYS